MWKFTLHPSGLTSDWVLFDSARCYWELSLKVLWEPWSAFYKLSIPCGLSSLHSYGLAVMDGRGTFNLLGIVDDEVAVPYNGEVHCQVTDLHTLIHVLKSRNRDWESAQEAETGREKAKARQRIEYIDKIQREREIGENERMKGQQRDYGFNHLSFSAMAVCSSPLWHVETQTMAAVTNHPHLRIMTFSYIVTVQ